MLPVTAFPAVGWTTSGQFFRFSAGLSSSVQCYGTLDGLVLFVTWINVRGLVLLLDVILNAVVTDRIDLSTPELDAVDSNGDDTT